MNLIVILSLAWAAGPAANMGPVAADRPIVDGYEISQADTPSAPQSTDSIVTGGTNADTIRDWEKRRKEQQNCNGCAPLNPYPGELKD